MSIPSQTVPQAIKFVDSMSKIYNPTFVLKKDNNGNFLENQRIYSDIQYYGDNRTSYFIPHIYPMQGILAQYPPVKTSDLGLLYTSITPDTVAHVGTCSLDEFVHKLSGSDVSMGDWKIAIFLGYNVLSSVFQGLPNISVTDLISGGFTDITGSQLYSSYKIMQVPDLLKYPTNQRVIYLYSGDRKLRQDITFASSQLLSIDGNYKQSIMYNYVGAGYCESYSNGYYNFTTKKLNMNSNIQVNDIEFLKNSLNPYLSIADLKNTDIATVLVYNETLTTDKWFIMPIAKFSVITKPYNEMGVSCTNNLTIIQDGSFQNTGEYGQNNLAYIRYTNKNNSSGTPKDSIKTPYQSSMLTIYNPILKNIQEIGDYLWTDSFIERLKKLYNDPKEALISLHKIPYMPKHNASAVNVTVCGAVVSETPCAVITDPIDEIDCGSVELNAYFGSFLDFSPYTKIRLYLPFCGEVTLNPEECINAKLSLKYSCNCLTGECLAQLRITRTAGDSPQGIALDNILYQKEGYMAFPYPLSSADYSRRTAALVQLGIGIGETAVGALTGAMPIAGRGIRDTLGAGADVATSKPSYSYKMSSGGLGFLGVRTPYLQVIRPNTAMPSTYGAQHGFMAQISGAVGDFVGYTEIADVHLDYVNCLGDEKEEIERLLKTGVIL